MTGHGKRLFGAGIVTAGILALIAGGVFSSHKPASQPADLTQDFSSASAGAAQQAVTTRAGWDYTGADDPAMFKDYIKTLSKDRALFMVLNDPDCSHCQDLNERLHQIQDQHLTRLDYDVLRVDLPRGSRIAWDMMIGRAVPECHVYYGDDRPIAFVGDMGSLEAAVNFMDGIRDAHASRLSAAPLHIAPSR